MARGWVIRGAVAAAGLGLAVGVGMLWSEWIFKGPDSGPQTAAVTPPDAAQVPPSHPAPTPEAVLSALEAELAAVRAGLATADEADRAALLRHQDRLLRLLSRPGAAQSETLALQAAMAEALAAYGLMPQDENARRFAAGDPAALRPALVQARTQAEAALRQAARTAHAFGLLALREGDVAAASGFLIRAAELDARTDHLRAAEETARMAGNLTAALALGPRLLAAVEAGQGAQGDDLAAAQAQVAQTLLAADRRDEAEALLRKALATAEAAGTGASAAQAHRLNLLGTWLHAGGDLEGAETLYRRALDLDRRNMTDAPEVAGRGAATAGTDPAVAAETRVAARLAASGPVADHAVAAMPHAPTGPIAPQGFAPDQDAAAVLVRFGNLATLLAATGRNDEALTLRAEASALARSGLRPDHPDLAAHLAAEADLRRAAGQGRLAAALYGEAAVALRAALGDAHPDLTPGLDKLAGALRASGGLSEAETLYREVLERSAATTGPAHADYGRALNNLGLVLRDSGRREEAAETFRQALAVLTAALGPDHANLAVVRSNLAAVGP